MHVCVSEQIVLALTLTLTFVSEAIALALQKYQLENEMTEDDTDISVFDTITSLMGSLTSLSFHRTLI